MGLFTSRLQGFGQHIDISIMETQLGTIDRRHSYLWAYQMTGECNPRQRPEAGGYPNGVYFTKDGYIEITGGRTRFAQTAQMMGMPELAEEPKFASIEAQMNPVAKDEFDAYFLPWLIERTKQEVFLAAQRFRVLCGAINTMEDILHDPHFQERGFFVEIEHPVTGKLKYPGAPFKAETPWKVRRPAPLLGQHNEEVLGELGYNPDDLARLREQGVI
jgi:crotonobetainyl-CoA:carnitine CoA-transferase CaiB-like acyl-CoA transferase